MPRKPAAADFHKRQPCHLDTHIGSNNLIILAVLLELDRVVALIAINNKHAVGANSMSL